MHFTDGAHHVVAKGFYGLGSFAGSRPTLTIALSLLCVLIMAGGTRRLVTETRPERLWVPENSEAQTDRAAVEATFPGGSESRIASAIFTLPGFDASPLATDGSAPSLLTPETVAYLVDLEARVSALTAIDVEAPNPALEGLDDDADVDGVDKTVVVPIVTWDMVCARFGEACAVQSLTQVPLVTSATTDALVLSAVNAAPSTNGASEADSLLAQRDAGQALGATVRDPAGASAPFLPDGPVVTAAAVKTLWILAKGERDGYNDTIAEAWEKVAVEFFEAELLAVAAGDRGPAPVVGTDTSTMTYLTTASFSLAFEESIGNDLILINVAVVCILLLGLLLMSRWSRGGVGSRVGLMVIAVIVPLLAFFSGLGLCGYAGVFYSPLMNVLPFLLLGIGVDDAFVIVKAFDRTDETLPPRKRLGLALSSAGASITTTSLTDIGAFLIGTNTSLPALRAFSIYAATCLGFTWLYSVTLLSACLALDARRENAGRLDCLCCLRGRAVKEGTGPQPCCGGKGMGREDWVSGGLKRVGRVLGTKVGTLCSLVLFVVLLAMGIAGAAQIQIDSDFNDFVPGGTELKTFIDVSSEAYGQTSPSRVAAYFTDAAIDYSSTETQSALDGVVIALATDPYVDASQITSWWSLLSRLDQLPECAANQSLCSAVKPSASDDRAAFDAKVHLWARDPTYSEPLSGDLFTNDVVFAADADDASAETLAAPPRLVATRIRAALGPAALSSGGSDDKIDAMDSTRETLADAVAGTPLDLSGTFVYGEDFLNYEQYKSVRSEFATNVGLALLLVVIIVAVLLLSPVASLITAGVVVAIVVETVGFLHWWGVTVDTVVVIDLVIALGLSVDYAVHVAHEFLQRRGTPTERIEGTLEGVGAAVLSGGLSTWLAVLLLSGSQSYVFEIFFRSLFLCTTLGLTNGLLCLPVLLMLANPRPHDAPRLEDLDDAAGEVSSVVVAKRVEAVPAAATVTVGGAPRPVENMDRGDGGELGGD